MPPRPPLTTLVIHTWKEHGKPRPFSNEETSEASARARVSRNISVDPQLTSSPNLSDDDSLPVHFRAHVSRSSTFDDGLSVHATHVVDRADYIVSQAMPRSVSVEDGMRASFRHGRKVQFEDGVLSNGSGSTPAESEDEGDNCWMGEMALCDGVVHRTGGEGELPPKPRACRMHRRAVSTSGVCLRGSSLLATSTPVTEACYKGAPHMSVVARATGLRVIEGMGVGEGGKCRKMEGIKEILDTERGLPHGDGVKISERATELLCGGDKVSERGRTGVREIVMTDGLLDGSVSLDTGLTVMANELNIVL